MWTSLWLIQVWLFDNNCLFCILCRTFHERKNDNAEILDFLQIKSQVTESTGAFTSPGSVVWAKTACQVWWPAEVSYC